MSKEEKEELITNHQFHQWKQNDCTKAIVKMIDSFLKIGEASIVNQVINATNIDVEKLNIAKGEYLCLHNLSEAILNKEVLEGFLEEKAEEVESV